MTEHNYYNKKIAYLDYLESGKKVKNAGYLKCEVRNRDCRIQIHIRGLQAGDTLPAEIKLVACGALHNADTMQLRYGAGEYTGKWDAGNLAGTGISYENCQGIIIRLSENRHLETIWEQAAENTVADNTETEKPVQTEEKKEAEVEIIEVSHMQEPRMETKELALTQEPETETVELVHTQEPETETVELVHTQASEVKKEELPDVDTKIKEQNEITKRDIKNRPERISGDKWVQLNRIYPHIRPFGDKREYLSVGPGDFIVLTRRYQNLVQNSFLLHGYYNYGHVILTKIREAEEDVYYLGVPGVYYDREKQAALMFGFEGFESATEVAGEGGFGYYMKRVDI